MSTRRRLSRPPEDTIISKTLDGIVTSWNAAAERHYGYRADEIVGHSILRLVPVDRVDEEHRILAAVLRRGEQVPGCSDGTPP